MAFSDGLFATKAIALLKANGWKVVPNGTDTCVQPGSGPGECGAGGFAVF